MPGSSSGLGWATAIHLANLGWTVYATARRTADLAEAAAAGCKVLALDVTDEASMVEAVRVIEAEHGAVGVLINNAGYAQSGAIARAISARRPRTRYTVSLSARVLLAQRALLSDRAWDWMMTFNMPSPGAE